MNTTIIDHCILNASAQSAHQPARTSQYTLLATACVSPAIRTRGLVRASPELRLRDYIEALSKSLTIADPRIGSLVILENSGFSAKEMVNLIVARVGKPGRDIEVLSYIAPERPDGVHYGYSEFQMIDHLMDESSLLTENFIKITGRYYYPNLSELLNRHSVPLRFLCDSKRIPSIGILNYVGSYSTKTPLFITERDFYNANLRKLYTKMHAAFRTTHVEDLIYDRLISMHGNDHVYLRFKTNCEPVGIGGNGDNLNDLSKNVKSLIREICRKSFPGIWI